MSTDFQKSLVLTHNEIARRAYEIYLERGAIAGNHEAHWSLAEQELKAHLQFEELLQKFRAGLPRMDEKWRPVEMSGLSDPCGLEVGRKRGLAALTKPPPFIFDLI